MTVSPDKRTAGGALRLLILGGTTEASALARAVAARPDVAPLLSLAGRTENPVKPPIPFRIGGFGGIEGLAGFLREGGIDAVVDATHPFAARISANAVAACRDAGVPLAVFTRPPWRAQADDFWTSVPDIAAAAAALQHLTYAPPPVTLILSRLQSGRIEGRTAPLPAGNLAHTCVVRPSTASLRDRLRMRGWVGGGLRVFLTTGRLDLTRFQVAPEHHYLVRTIDPPGAADLPRQATVLLAKPPFEPEDEIRLMEARRIDLLVTKNSGGEASAAKLAAARRLGLPVLMIERPVPSGPAEYQKLEPILAWVTAQTGAAAIRGG